MNITNLNKIKINLLKLINLSSIDSILSNDPEFKFKIYNAFSMGKDFSYEDINKMKKLISTISFPLYRGVYLSEFKKYNLDNISVGDSFKFDRLTSFSSISEKAESFTASERTWALLKSNNSKNVFPFVDALEYCIRHPVEEMFKLTRNPKDNLDWFIKNKSNNESSIKKDLDEQEYFVFDNSKFIVTNINNNFSGKYGTLKLIEGNIE